MTTKPMTAWVIEWKWFGDHAVEVKPPLLDVDQPIIDIVSGRKGEEYVMDYLQRLHDLLQHTLTERADIQRNHTSGNNRPYKVMRSPKKSGPAMNVGHNPHLMAKKVKNLVVSVDPETRKETVKYEPWLDHTKN